MSLTPQLILNSPDYYPLQFEGGNLVFVAMSRASYADSIFTMPSRIVTASNQAWSVPFADVVRITESEQAWQSAELLLQIAHCGSTLLSRALDVPGQNLVIREPYALRQLLASPLGKDATQQQEFLRALRAIWVLLSRRYHPEQPVLIKGNVPYNFKLRSLIQVSGLRRAVFLHSELEDYLLAIVKDTDRTEWVKYVISESAAYLKNINDIQLDKLSGLQAATVLWSAQLQARDVEQALTDIRSIRAADFLSVPRQTMDTCSKYLQLNLNARHIDERMNSSLFSKHAKKPEQSYSAAQRERELTELKNQFAEEIGNVIAWGKEKKLMFI